MCSITINNKKTVEVQIGEEVVHVDKKMIMRKSKLFHRVLSVNHSGALTVGLHQTTVSAFNTFFEICQKEKNCIKKTNFSQIAYLAELIECDSVKEKCAEYIANMSDEDEVFVTLNVLEKIAQMSEDARPDNLKEYLERVFCGDFLIENRKNLRSISSEAKSILLESVVDDLSDLSTHLEWMEKETGRMKKIEKKNSILEAQLMKALNDVRISNDKLKSSKDAQSELAKLKKRLSVSEKKSKSQEDELEKLRIKLTSENKKNQVLQNKLEETQIKLEKEKQSFEVQNEKLRESFNFEKEAFASEQSDLHAKLSLLKESVDQLQNENKLLSSNTKMDIQPTDDFSDFEWNRLLSPSSVCEEDIPNIFTTSTTCDWKRRPVWTNYDFLYL